MPLTPLALVKFIVNAGYYLSMPDVRDLLCYHPPTHIFILSCFCYLSILFNNTSPLLTILLQLIIYCIYL
jgi:hypothetical protein